MRDMKTWETWVFGVVVIIDDIVTSFGVEAMDLPCWFDSPKGLVVTAELRNYAAARAAHSLI